MSELDSMLPDQSLGLPDKPISSMSDEELDSSGFAEESPREVPDGAQSEEPQEAAATEAVEAAEPEADKTNLQIFQETAVAGQDANEEDSELARLRQETGRLQRELDKRRDDELEHARSLLQGQAPAEPDSEGPDEIDYLDPSLVSQWESLGVDRDHAEAILSMNGKLIEERARQIFRSESQSLRDEMDATKKKEAAVQEQNSKAKEVASGMARLVRLGGTPRDLVQEYVSTGSGNLWEYINAEPGRMTSASTVYDAGLGLSAMVDTVATSQPASSGATSLPAGGSDRGQRLDETKRDTTEEDAILDGLSRSADPFKGKIPFLSNNFQWE